jgi:hypothetical protein
VLCGVVGVALALFVPFAYERMTTPPSRAWDDNSDLIAALYTPPPNDATQEWLEVLAQLPPPPAFDEPPPPGMQWDFTARGSTPPSIDATVLLGGQWDPDSRPILRSLIRYISSDAMTATLRRVTQLRDRPWIWYRMLPGADVPPAVQFSSMRHVVRLLASRSRYHRQQRGNIDAAWEDLKTVLVLTRSNRDSTVISVLVNIACEALALSELSLMSLESQIPDTIARDMQTTLSTLPGVEPTWAAVMHDECRYTLIQWVAPGFTLDATENGWLVLSEQPDLRRRSRPASSNAGRSRLWNLFSGFYHDRRTVEQRVRAYFAALAAAPTPDYLGTLAQIHRIYEQLRFGHGDGPILYAIGCDTAYHPLTYQLLVRTRARRSAVRIMVALNRYHAVYADYPETLDELVPDFLRVLPNDPYCGGQFGYRREDGDRYLLYSCGRDGEDDGGCMGGWGAPQQMSEDGDDIYTVPRDEPVWPEPVAVPLPETQPTVADEE